MKPWPLFAVEVYGYPEEVFTARTRDKARWRAWEAFREHHSTWDFHRFLIETSIRRLERPPFDDGYDNVFAQYGVTVRIGETLVLQHEGPNSGREVVVLYPGRHTCMVHCAYVGDDRAMIVHPLNVRRAA